MGKNDVAHEAPLARLTERLDVLAVRVSDPAERALPDLVGLACFHDFSKQGVNWLDTRQPGHAERLRQQLDQRAQSLSRAGIRQIDLGSEVDDLLPLLAPRA